MFTLQRSLQKITKSILFHCFPDGLCVSGVSAGSETDDDILKDVKAVADSVLFFAILAVLHRMWHRSSALWMESVWAQHLEKRKI